MKNGDKVILKEDLFFHVNYPKGEIFTIIGGSMRGWDIKCDRTGRIIYECLMIHGKFENYSIKQERKEKLKKLKK